MHVIVRDNIKQVLGYTASLSSQYPFAVATGLTAVAREVAGKLPADMRRAFDRPTTFTERGLFTTPARKDRLTASVSVKDKQAVYLAYQVLGGTRAPTKRALRLPADVQLNAHGNLPAGVIRQLIARANAGKRATKRQSERFRVSGELDLFYGEPGDGRPAGIYKRVVISATRHQLVPLIVFPKQSAHYSRRLDYFGAAKRYAVAALPDAMRKAWATAKATAKR